MEEYLNQFGDKGSIERLRVISVMNLDERSKAASLVIQKRERRKEIIDMGLGFENAVLIVNREFSECNKNN